MNSPLISVIVPVYKVEKFLDKCISSLISQSYKNLEIILVDDGSPDKSGKICDAWSNKDDRILVIHQRNSGAGAARNTALKKARGDYITFVDSDDYIAPQMYEYMLSLFENDIDIVECDYVNVWDDYMNFDNNESVDQAKLYTCVEALKENIQDHYFRQLIWNKLYRKNVVEGIFFPVGKKIDDEFWTYRVLGNAKRLLRSNKKLYAYRQQETSVMHSITSEQRLQALDAKIERHRYIKKIYPELIEESSLSILNTCMYQGQLILSEDSKEKEREYLVKLKSILDTNVNSLTDFSTKQKFWFFLAKKSLKFTCYLRNQLGIGI